MSDEFESIIHIVGLSIQVGNRIRQRCAWCGAVISDEDLSRMAFQIPEGKTEEQARADGDFKPPHWEPGSLIEMGRGFRSFIEHKDGDQLPANACAQLDDEVTGMSF